MCPSGAYIFNLCARNIFCAARLGKLACPRVNDNQKIDVDDHKHNSGRPHDYGI